MIIESLVTTLNSDGTVNFAPMGVVILDKTLYLHPYQTSHTFKNLVKRKCGVVNITDDILAITQAALSDPKLPTRPADSIEGYILKNSYRFYEFKVEKINKEEKPAEVLGKIIKQKRTGDFVGINRAKNALLEIVIMATRLRIKYSVQEVKEELDLKRSLIQKTGGEREEEACRFIEGYLDDY